MTDSAFLHGTFNDLLLIPAALPILLWIERMIGLRTHDRPPTALEIGAHWAIWSVIAEGIGPRIFPGVVGDGWDVVAYAAGALAAGLWWNLHVFTRNSAI